MVAFFLHGTYNPVVALNIKNPEVERLAQEVADLTGESKTEAVRRALEERRARLAFRVVAESKSARLRGFLEREVWPTVPEDELGRVLSRAEEEAILGYGESGV
jgi:antitoxin VapB